MPIRCDLQAALEAQEVDAVVFLPFAIYCLSQENPAINEAVLTVNMGDKTEELLVFWNADSVRSLSPAVQSHIITEWGALGIACAVLYSLGNGLRIVETARLGDRFDYWITNGEREYALEVSGTYSDSLTDRHQDKVQQLSENPYGLDGYVIVVRFASREVWFTFHYC
jgi:hypothetical protein